MNKKIQNIGVIAHIDAGKTTTTERMLFMTGKTHRIGTVDQGTATMDWMEQEQNRGITISSAATSFVWKDTTINLIDTPGHVDFTVEVERSLKVLDGAIGVFCAVGGVEPQSETVWNQSQYYHVAKIAYINKMDRLGADFYHVLQDIEKKLKILTLPLYLPIGKEKDFEGIIDVLEQKEIHWNEVSEGTSISTREIRSELQSLAQEYYQTTIETLCELDEEHANTLAELYLNEREVPKNLIIAALKEGVLAAKILPILCGSSLKNIGIQPLLDAVVSYLPSPAQVPLPLLHNPVNNSIVPWDDDDRLLAIVFKTELHKDFGLMLYTRVYRGSIAQSVALYDLNTGKKERVTRILRMHSHKAEQIETLVAGEIGVLIGPRFTRTGHTISNIETPIHLFEPLNISTPVITSSIEVHNLSEREKLLDILAKLEIEDPSFLYKEDENTGQILISGMGELHLEVLTTRITSDYNIPVRQGTPQVNYREGVSKQACVCYNLAEQHSKVLNTEHLVNIIIDLVVSPSERGAGLVFTHSVLTDDKNKSKDSSASPIELWCIAEIEKAINESATTGIVLGYPIIDIAVSLNKLEIEGELKIDNFALKYVASQAFHNACKQAEPIKLEPIMKVIISVPEEYVGEAMSTINSRRGIVHSAENNGRVEIIRAEAPMRELFGFTTALRNATQGRGSFNLEFDHYDKAIV